MSSINNNELRPLTAEEKLEWYVSFLEEQIKTYELELKKVKDELSKIQNKKLESDKEKNLKINK